MSTHATEHLVSNGLEAEDTANGVDRDTIDETFELLSNSRRRAAIRVILEHEHMDFSELVTKVAEIEYGLPADQISSEERHTIYVALQQSHISKLEDNEIVERDRDTGTIRLAPNAPVMKAIMKESIAKIDGEDSLGSKLKRAFAF